MWREDRRYGVGQAAAKGVIMMDVTVGGLTFAGVEFAVVEELPVPGLLGKPSLTAMGARLDSCGTWQNCALGR